MKRRNGRAVVALAVVCASLAGGAASAQAHGDHHQGGSCPLGNGSGPISHVIYLQFDNTHFTRDRPDVPSDLEQMPHLLDFLQGKGRCSPTTTRS